MWLSYKRNTEPALGFVCTLKIFWPQLMMSREHVLKPGVEAVLSFLNHLTDLMKYSWLLVILTLSGKLTVAITCKVTLTQNGRPTTGLI